MRHVPTLICLLLVTFHPAIAGAQPTALSGLTTDAVVVYDSNGIPHICTGSDRDAAFMLGYIHAQDRFFQMDTLRRTFSGTLAELVGAAALGSDVQFRTFGLRRAAGESLAAYSAAGLDAMVDDLTAYAAGVNRYLQDHPLPPEYGALEISQAAPWTVMDSLVIVKGLAFGLSFGLPELDLTVKAGTFAAVGAAAGFDGMTLFFEDVNRSAPFDPTVSIPPKSQSQPPGGGLAAKIAAPSPRAVALARSYRDKVAAVPRLEKTLHRRGGETGSNWWIVSSERSESGFPMLANDPHLGLDTPSTFYEAHLITSAEPQCGLGKAGLAFTPAGPAAVKEDTGLNANGITFAGLPGIVLGCNTEICWGATTNPMDVTDVYQEILVVDPATGLPTATTFEGNAEPLVFIPQTFRVNQIGDGTPDNLADAGVGPLDGGFTLVVPRRNNGPIVNIDASQLPVTALSVQYSGWRGTLELEAFRRWQHAGSLDEFVEGVQYFDVGSQNWGYADVDGNIAYFTSAELPLREDLQNLGVPAGGIPPFLIRDGTHTLPHEWLPVTNPQPQQSLAYEILPFDEMPQVVNPAEGYVANANNDPVGNTLDNDPLNEMRPGGGVFYLNPGYASLRVGQIDRMLNAALAGGKKATADDLKAMQASSEMLDAEVISPFVFGAFANASAPIAAAELQALAQDPGVAEAVARLMNWGFTAPTGLAAGYDPGDDPANLPQPSAQEVNDSVAATIWSVFRGQVVRDVIDGTLTNLGLGDVLPGSREAYNAFANLLQNYDTGQGIGASGVDFFQAGAGLTPDQERDLILLRNLRAALDLLASDEFAPAFGNSTDQDDYRWGFLHRIVMDHPLGGPFSVPPAGGFSDLGDGLPGISRSGGYQSVDASSHSPRADGLNDFMFGAGPARRFVGVLDPNGIQADQIIPGGESGVLGSPHYASQLGRWLTNDYHPLLLTADDVQGDSVSRQEFAAACTPGPTTLCFRNRRFKVEGTWAAREAAGPSRSVLGASNASGNLWFFDPENWEILVKVLDGCNVNGHFWVFASAATDVGWDLTVEDTETGVIWSASNPLGQRSPAIIDTTAFATCP